MRIADGGGGGDVSSASPQALIAYSEAGQRIDSDLESESVRLGAALVVFEATCKEYSTGVTAALADELQAFARLTSADDVWVGKVGKAFALADGGSIASVLALNPDDVGNWSTLNKLKYAVEQAIARLPGDVASRLESMLTPENLAAMAGLLAVWGGAQFFGVGEIADVLMIGVAAVTLGPDAIRVGKDLGEFAIGVHDASNTGDLSNAGAKLADAISVGGVDGALAFFFKKAGDAMPEGPAGVPDLVTPEGIVVNVPSGVLEKNPGLLSAASDPNVTPQNVVVDAMRAEAAANGTDPNVVPVNPTPEEVQAWMDGLPSKATPNNTPADQYEILQTGPLNYLIPAGNETVWADGVLPPGARLLEAKYISNPDSSPYVEGSKAPPFIRQQVDDEFRRYALALSDPNNPVNALQVIVNDYRSVPFFENLMQKYNIPGEIVVRSWTPPQTPP